MQARIISDLAVRVARQTGASVIWHAKFLNITSIVLKSLIVDCTHDYLYIMCMVKLRLTLSYAFQIALSKELIMNLNNHFSEFWFIKLLKLYARLYVIINKIIVLMDNLHYRLPFDQDNKNEIPRKNFLKVVKFQNSHATQ